jgi:hypothetical protein
MYAPPEAKIAPLGSWRRCDPVARRPLAGNNFAGKPPLVAIPYHQMRLKGNNFYNPAGDYQKGYKERLAMIASPIVAFAEGLDDR